MSTWDQEKLNEKRLTSFRGRRAKYILNYSGSNEELCLYSNDPNGTTNVIDEYTELTEDYYDRMTDVLGEYSGTDSTQIENTVIEQLKSLGYVDDGK